MNATTDKTTFMDLVKSNSVDLVKSNLKRLTSSYPTMS